jgi:hypothetical protein
VTEPRFLQFGRAGRLVVLLTTVVSALLMTVVSANASTDAGAPAVPAQPRVSTFDFQNDHISHFHATLRFVNRNEFVITNITLTHLACDHRAAYADVFDQNGQQGRFVNSTDCLNTTRPPDRILTDGGGVRYVQIRLRDCGSTPLNGCSSSAWSLRHYNPF